MLDDDFFRFFETMQNVSFFLKIRNCIGNEKFLKNLSVFHNILTSIYSVRNLDSYYLVCHSPQSMTQALPN